MMKLSDYVIEFLEQHNVKDVFMVTGGGCMHLVDSFGKSTKIKYTCTHHEQGSAMAAEAYAKMMGDLGVCLVTSGPGGTNTVTGLLGAFQDSVPCLFLSGQSKRQQTVYNSNIDTLRQFGVQEVNIIPIVESITKYAAMINQPEMIKYHLEKAIYLAKSGRPGPVWLDIPLDIQSAQIDEENLESFDANEEKLACDFLPSETDLNSITELLQNSRRPVVIAGHGIRLAHACKEFRQFIELNNLPVVTPIMGIDVLPSDHPNYIGRIGTKGTRAGNFAMQNADLILSIGSRLSVSVVGHEYGLFAREAQIIVVDIDPQEHQKKTINIDMFVNADAKAFVEMMNLKTQGQMGKKNKGWLRVCNDWKEKYPVCLPEYQISEKINFYYFVDQLTKNMSAEVPVISDAGSAFYVVSQAINVQENQRYITSGAIATMGFGLPAAIGVCIANVNKPVVSITGDGSFQQNIQELQTIAHHNLPTKIFVINNNGYLSIKQTQSKFFNGRCVGESSLSGVSFPKTEKIADAYEIKYIRINDNSQLIDRIKETLNYDGPVICEVMTDEDQLVIPTNSAYIKLDGTMISKPLEDMFPFLDREEFLANMIVEPINE
ncbi:MAG: thiamine pyrophosphate-binding protein [Desulfitobacteriaceae bacterium]